METRLGAEFSAVRLHSGSVARASAAAVGARAYTSGSHVVIGDGGADKHTLAHELTHVIQQRTGPVEGTDYGGGVSISDPLDTFEQAAESNAVRVMSGLAPRPRAAPPTDNGGRHWCGRGYARWIDWYGSRTSLSDQGDLGVAGEPG